MQIGVILGFVINTAFFIATTPVATDAPERVSRVVDGDTIVMVGGERVRLSNVDTPEMRCRCEIECTLARRATETTRRLTRDGVFLQRRPNRDRYNRTLAEVFLPDGRELGGILISRGLARSYHGERRLSWCDAPAPRH